jgi:hypothetical protein
VLVPAVWAFKQDSVAATRFGFVVTSFNTTLVTTTVGIVGVGGRADRAGGGVFFAELSWVAELAAVAALGNEGGGEHLFAFAKAGEQADGVLQEHSLIPGNGDDDGGGCLRPVGWVRFQKVNSVNGGSFCKANGLPHGIEEVSRGGGST